jgi:predicted TIM-barrel fold metal-dependent hydrolase
MIIDVHQHTQWHGWGAAKLVADMDEQGIDRAWLLSCEIPPLEDEPTWHAAFNPVHVRTDGTHPGLPLCDVLATREAWPDRFIPGWCPWPGLPNAPDLLEAAVQMHGIRACGEWKFRMLLDDPRSLQVFRRAGKLGLPVTVHIDVPYMIPPASAAPAGGAAQAVGPAEPVYQRSWFGGTVENLARALGACPGTTFLGHAPGFWREISGDAAGDPKQYPDGPVAPGGRLAPLLEGHPNLFCDLSANSALTALRRDPDHARRFLTRFADRLLFGRDQLGGETLAFLRGLGLPAEALGKVLGGNAARLLGGEKAD